jgi:lipopolysaccharide export system protein LptA
MYPADRNYAAPALAGLALVALVAALPAAAKSTDRQQPLDVRADSCSALLEDGAVSTLRGNVEIVQGTLRVDADHAEIHQADGDIRQVVLTGAPARLRQVADNGEPTNATAARIVYTLSEELMVLTGNVVITQPRGNLRGETVKYDINTGRLDGGGDGNRVSMRIMPRAAPATPPAESTPTDSND